MRPIKNIWIWGMAFGLFLLSSCSDSAIYESNRAVENKAWEYEDTLSFDVPIADISILYDVLINIRHTSEYPYSNLWLKVITEFPSGKTDIDRLNLPMADNSGKWMGDGLGSVKSNMVLIQQYARLPETGNYRFHIIQDMRQSPLNDIMDIGLRIEKTQLQDHQE